ncbi:hypothetical protein BMS3Bbin12_00613 [bacterium BMS3Bbin12]|nr:hypothetical protein BMS3Abin12_01546 [bacterium BMS3Abin12]GBE47453.1 hypothetical protein BMS3Bbin12_00613 [bacterium BMS3Bbin12]GBE51133.1 hypothetical protein BMS3Bbin13_02088 [bacterium BMS3Bbin13]
MRAIVLDHVFRGDLLVRAALLNIAYLAVGAAVFPAAFHTARRRGLPLAGLNNGAPQPEAKRCAQRVVSGSR